MGGRPPRRASARVPSSFWGARGRGISPRSQARDRQRRLRESVCWIGGIKKPTFLAKVKDAAKIGAFGRVIARGKPLSQHSVSELGTLFDEIDEDGNGDLTAQEFLGGLEAIDAEKNRGKRKKPPRLARINTAPLALGGVSAGYSTHSLPARLGSARLRGARPDTAASDASSTASLRDLLAALPDRPGTFGGTSSESLLMTAPGRPRGVRALKSCYVR